MDVLILGVNTASPGGCSTSSDARCEAGMLLKGPWEDPKPLWRRLHSDSRGHTPCALPKASYVASGAGEGATKTSRSALERLGSVTRVIDLQDTTLTST